MPRWLKTVLEPIALLLALPGLPLIIGWLCVAAWTAGDDSMTIALAIYAFTLVALTLGVGIVVFLHSARSLDGQRSGPVRLPAPWLLAGVFALCIAQGSFIWQARVAPPFLFPPVLLAAAALPSLLAISWFMQGAAGGFTWRRGLVAFAGGATVSAALAVLLEVLFPSLLLALVLGFGERVIDQAGEALAALAGQEIGSAIANPGFIFVFVQIAIVAPLAEELVKPLVTLPILGRLSRRDAFLVAAAAGAGFAALENVLYVALAPYLWAGILLVRALGAAVHPLGAGLVGLAWRDILRREPRAAQTGAARFALACGLHGVWNGGSLFVITLAGARFFGELPPEVNLLGLSAAGTTLAFLLLLGLGALWLGRAVAQDTDREGVLAGRAAEAQFVLSDRAVAIWALACLVAIVPAGVAGLRLLIQH